MQVAARSNWLGDQQIVEGELGTIDITRVLCLEDHVGGNGGDLTLKGSGADCFLEIRTKGSTATLELQIWMTAITVELYHPDTGAYVGTTRASPVNGISAPKITFEARDGIKIKFASTAKKGVLTIKKILITPKAAPDEAPDVAIPPTSQRVTPMDIILRQAVNSGALDGQVLSGLIDNLQITSQTKPPAVQSQKNETQPPGVENLAGIPGLGNLAGISGVIESRVRVIVEESVKAMEERLKSHIDSRFDQLLSSLRETK